MIPVLRLRGGLAMIQLLRLRSYVLVCLWTARLMPALVGSIWMSFVRTLKQPVVSEFLYMVGVQDFGGAFLLQIRRDFFRFHSCEPTWMADHREYQHVNNTTPLSDGFGSSKFAQCHGWPLLVNICRWLCHFPL